jgi:uncharacterized protein (DUF1330 family)
LPFAILRNSVPADGNRHDFGLALLSGGSDELRGPIALAFFALFMLVGAVATAEAAMRWYDCEEYRRLKDLRQSNAQAVILLAKGVR